MLASTRFEISNHEVLTTISTTWWSVNHQNSEEAILFRTRWSSNFQYFFEKSTWSSWLYIQLKKAPAKTRLLLTQRYAFNVQAPCARGGRVRKKSPGIDGLVVKLEILAVFSPLFQITAIICGLGRQHLDYGHKVREVGELTDPSLRRKSNKRVKGFAGV